MPDESRHVDVPNARLHSTRQGDGPPIVFLHGGPGMWDYLRPVGAMFADRHAAIGYDQRGCGRSAGGPPYDVATAVADLEAVRRAWGVYRWTLFGHSWGASLGLAYAVAHPERTRGLVYVSGTGVDPAWHDEYRRNRLSRLSPAQQARFHELRQLGRKAEREYAELYAATDLADPTAVPRLLAWLQQDGFEVNQESNRELGQDANRVVESDAFRDQVRRLAAPTLVLHGALDPRPARFAEQLAALIPAAELAILPNVGHFPRFEDPDAFADAVRPFLERLHS
jgi:proline iminopeptidase